MKKYLLIFITALFGLFTLFFMYQTLYTMLYYRTEHEDLKIECKSFENNTANEMPIKCLKFFK